MNGYVIDEFAKILNVKLNSIIKKYNLKVVGVDNSEALVVGSSYALQFFSERDQVEVMYIDYDKRGGFSSYTLRPLVMQRFTKDDRFSYGNPETPGEKIIASLNVYAAGLENRCCDVLSGEKSWLRREEWTSGFPAASTQAILKHEFRV
ncbi:hypothetical protein JH314_09240 [Xanthomonas campestris]|uniref:hypothetical protein n=1 Tax=Xanthomonas campestris TaxID=339 RepID=UPI00236837F5|nr:hypothetical protein [Xanthomonas campestris]WDJ03556.1 hypothetical protein JH314_09240 [Xanthomonas campestris]WDK33344.1 hypothetical protein JH307_09370 [Xanthomonas campestris]